MNPRQMNYRWACWLKSAWLWRLIDRLNATVSPRSLSWQGDRQIDDKQCSDFFSFFDCDRGFSGAYLTVHVVCAATMYIVLIYSSILDVRLINNALNIDMFILRVHHWVNINVLGSAPRRLVLRSTVYLPSHKENQSCSILFICWLEI